MTLITEITLSSTATQVTFSSIPQTYSHLWIEAMFANSQTGDAIRVQFNGDTNGNYSNTAATGYGTGAGIARESNQTSIRAFGSQIGPTTSWGAGTIWIPGYSLTTINKSQLARYSVSDGDISHIVGAWRSNAAITSIRCFNIYAYNMSVGTKWRLWGLL